MPVQPYPPAAVTYANLRIMTLNIRSLANDNNRRQFFKWLQQQPYDLIALQETGSYITNFNTTTIDKWRKDWGGNEEKSWFTKYCGLLVNHSQFVLDGVVDNLGQGRILSAILKLKGQVDDTLRVTCVYLPADDRTRPGFLRTLDLRPIHHPCSVVLGDFNSVNDPIIDRNPPLSAATPQCYHHISSWQEVVDAIMLPLNLVDTALPRSRDRPYFTHYHKHTDAPPPEPAYPDEEIVGAVEVELDYEEEEAIVLEAEEEDAGLSSQIRTDHRNIPTIGFRAASTSQQPTDINNIQNSSSRIDYLLVSSHMLGTVSDQKVASCPCPGADRVSPLDHMMVSATIFSSDRPTQQRANILDERLLADKDFVAKVERIFTALDRERAAPGQQRFTDVAHYWDTCKSEILKAGTKFGKKKRRRNAEQKRKLIRDLKWADTQLGNRPRYQTAIDERIRCLTELADLERNELVRIALMGKVKWLEEGERATPFFTQQLIARRNKARIESLKDAEGVSSEDPADIARIARAFYALLYSSEPTNRESQDTLLDAIVRTVAEEDSVALDADLTTEELSFAIDSMPVRSSPGSDGLTYVFYKTFKHRVIPILLELLNSIGPDSVATLPPSHGQSMTVLLFKKGDREEIGNYRPISLTQCDYKIFTKALTNRINPVADQIIDSHQTGFIPGRQGHDNVMLIDLLVHYFQEGNSGEASILSLDQQKAYDRVEWSYLRRCLEGFGFGPRLRRWIDVCYTDLTATIHLGHSTSEPYQVHRGLRQGDPLAPILFNFVLEPFLLHYSRIASGPPVEGISLKVAAFADDTNLLMGPGDGPHAEAAIRLHEEASGAKINQDKSELIPLTRTAHDVIVLPQFRAVEFGSSFSHLGIVIRSEGRDMKVIEKDIIKKLQSSIAGWRTRRLTFQGRITVLNTYFLSKLWYVASFYTFSKDFYKQIDKLCKHVLWPTTNARISLHWYRQSRELGGWGLLHPEHQVKALKAKWLARRQTEDLRWVPLLDLITRKSTNERLVRDVGKALDKPTKTSFYNLGKQNPYLPATITESIRAFLEMRPAAAAGEDRPGHRVLLLGDTVSAATYEVARGRQFLDKITKEKHATKEVKTSTKVCDYPAIPRFMGLRAQEVVRVEGGPAIKNWDMPAVPDEQWKETWKRFWDPARRPNERTFLYQLYHKVIWTNGYKANMDMRENVEAHCRWCFHLVPSVETRESRGHAFHDCVRVSDQWHRLRRWIASIFPSLAPLPDSPHQEWMCWPTVAHLPKLAIHLHSAVCMSIWQTYCDLGDGEKHVAEYLGRMVLAAIKSRARVEQARAIRLDQLTDAKHLMRRDPLPESTTAFDRFKTIWHHPGVIDITTTGIEWGPLWDS